MAKKKDKKDKVYAFSITLRGDQIDWVNKNPKFKVYEFFRQQLDKYIQLKEDVRSISK